MQVAIIGTGFIATTLGRALSEAGHTVVYGSRHPESEDTAGRRPGRLVRRRRPLRGRGRLPGPLGAAVTDLAAQHGDALAGTLVIDATNQMRADVVNAHASLPSSVRYATPSTRSGVRTWRTPCSTASAPTCSSPTRGRSGDGRDHHRGCGPPPDLCR